MAKSLDARSFRPGAIAIACCLAPATLADELHVPADFPTIQSAIDAAADGDEVIVAPGSYTEALRLWGKAITLRGSGGAAMTTLSGSGLGTSILVATDGETPATLIEGLTFAAGAGTPGSQLPNCFSFTARCGGAVYIGTGASVTLSGCRFVQNASMVAGGAIYVHEGGLRAQSCEFQGNNASHGGGVSVCRASLAVEMVGCLFTGNSAAHGGGVNADDDAPTLLLSGCTFVSNTASHGGGAVLRRAGGVTVVEDCVFFDNEAAFGAGLNLTIRNTESGLPSAGAVNRCTFTSNRSGFGGGIFAQASLDPGLAGGGPVLLVADSMFAANSAGPCCNAGAYVSPCWQDGAGFGGGADLRVQNGHAIAVNCQFDGNTGARGSAVSAATCGEPDFGLDGGTVEIVNCTMNEGTGSGVDLRVGSTGVVRLSNSIVRASSGAEVGRQIKNPVAGQATIAVEYSNIEGGHAGTGNIDADPRYVNPAVKNFRLGPGSPSIDAGNAAALPAGIVTDLAGLSRRTDDPWMPDTGPGGAPAVDMGAYEFQGVSCIADFNRDGFLDGIDYDSFHNAFEAGHPSADTNNDGFVDAIDADLFNNSFEGGC